MDADEEYAEIKHPKKSLKSTRVESSMPIRMSEDHNQKVVVKMQKIKPKGLLPASQIRGTGFDFRDNLRSKLVDMLCEKARLPETEFHIHKDSKLLSFPIIVDLALRLENKMFELYKCGKAYNDKTRSILFNLQDQNNNEPMLALILQKVTAEEFVTLDVRKLASSKMKKAREEHV